MTAKRVNRGSKMLTAAEQNRYADAANLSLRQETAEPLEDIIRRNDSNLARVQNTTEFNLRTGDVMELHQMLIQGTVRRRELMWSVRYPETEYDPAVSSFRYDPLGGRCGVILEDIPAGQTGWMQMTGIALARVVLRSLEHRHACFSAGFSPGGNPKGRWLYSAEQGEALLLPVGYDLTAFVGQDILMPVVLSPLHYRRPLVRCRLLGGLSQSVGSAVAVVEESTEGGGQVLGDFFGLRGMQYGGGYVQLFPPRPFYAGQQPNVIVVLNFGSGRNNGFPYKFEALPNDYLLAAWTGVEYYYIPIYVFDQQEVTTTAPPSTTTSTTGPPTTSDEPTTTTATTTVPPTTTTAPPTTTTAPPTTTTTTTTTTAAPGCGTCTYSWADMLQEWVLTSGDCTTALCNCVPPSSPGSFDGQVVVTDCA